MQKNTIELRDLAIGYRNRQGVRTVAQGISAHIFSGELTCLLGANGIGKSTLLRTLSAFQPKLSGQIFIQGTEIASYSEQSLATLVSVVLTEKLDIRNMSVRELVALGRSPYTGFWGKLMPDDQAAIDRAIALVRIEGLAHRMVHTLSDGERQKAMIAKALAQDTPIIFLDEPTAFLDFPSKVEMMQLLHRLSRATHKTIFLSTHDLELALQIADKIWLMDDRAPIRVGTPEDLSLNGDLSGFFARKGILFDRETGLFRVENDFDRQVRLVGHGQRYAMIRKALLRNRIFAARGIDSPICVEVVDNRIRISHCEGSLVWCDSIEELLGELVHNKLYHV
ncbi:MAG: ABC transporter ATP-binding protein [Bacteroidales bacterium]|nr:ABC transporter ATP-binding protein [Bacteroidales bacterium]MBN2750982.1 ABC transporter ATP-binding protein [Bacteroidales bacterium]